MKSGFFSSSLWHDRGLLVHGGIENPDCRTPQNTLALLPLKNFNELQVLDKNGPTLSHHSSCIVTMDSQDILVLIGGWTGHSRTSQVYAFDLKTKSWIKGLTENPKGHHRVDPPVGLSGHTATKINSKLICVIGREGGIKTQRKFGQMFLLHLDLKNKFYWYSESPIMPESRSGHTALLSPPVQNMSSLLIFGGRDIDHIFICGQWKTDLVENPPESKAEAKSKLKKITFKRMTKMMGLRYHAMLALTSDCILIHGGRHFKAISSKNINDGFFLCSLGKNGEESWVQLDIQPSIPRFAHTMCLVNDDIFIIGGFSSEDNKEAAKTEKLSLSNFTKND